ncbi:MAG: metal-dependent hydrolase [Candidatus Methylomirabilales bacterium]
MDTVTHALAGTLIAQAGFRQRMGRVATGALTVSAAAPDIDGFMRFQDTALYLSVHRGITHSFVGGAVLALLLAALFYRFSAYKHYWRLAGLCYLGILSHIVLDLFTSYGTAIFLPFNGQRIAWDTLFIIDIFVSGVIVVGIVLAYRWPSHSIRVGRTALVLLGGYMLVAAAAHQLALIRLRGRVERENLPATRLAAFPMPFGPLRWSGVVATDEATYHVIFSLLDRGDRSFRVYPLPRNGPLFRRAEEEDVVALFRWFARFPVVTVRRGAVGPVVQYFDLQFSQIEGRQPFLVEVDFDRHGQPRSSGFAPR